MIKYIKLIAVSADPRQESEDRQGSTRPHAAGIIAAEPSFHAH